MSIEAPVGQSARQTFMKEDGFILYNDVIDQLLDRLADEPLLPVTDGYDKYEPYADLYQCGEIFKSAVELYLVSRLFDGQVPQREDVPAWDWASLFGLSKEEAAQASQYTYDLGLDDLNFPWHFSPALASLAVHSFVETGKLSREEAALLTLDDWADIIDSAWLKDLSHAMSRTGFGVYANFGSYLSHYTPRALHEYIEKARLIYWLPAIKHTDILDVHDAGEEGKGIANLKATLNADYHSLLRSIRERNHPNTEHLRGKTDGYPMARDAAMLPEDFAASSPRVARLQALGHLSVSGKPNAHGKVLVTQEESAIDRNLSFIAAQYRAYYQRYGAPAFLPR